MARARTHTRVRAHSRTCSRRHTHRASTAARRRRNALCVRCGYRREQHAAEAISALRTCVSLTPRAAWLPSADAAGDGRLGPMSASSCAVASQSASRCGDAPFSSRPISFSTCSRPSSRRCVANPASDSASDISHALLPAFASHSSCSRRMAHNSSFDISSVPEFGSSALAGAAVSPSTAMPPPTDTCSMRRAFGGAHSRTHAYAQAHIMQIGAPAQVHTLGRPG